MTKLCPICGLRLVLAVGLESCDECAHTGPSTREGKPTPDRRPQPSRPGGPRGERECRICHRTFVPRTGVQKRCEDCCKDGIGGSRYENGQKVPRRKSWGEDGRVA